MHITKLITTENAAQTFALARRIGALLPAGTAIAASGDLGAGKTVFAAGLAAGLGVNDTVTSPTYIFFNDYAGRAPFCHIDAYRLENLSEEEITLIGLDECFRPDKAVFVEWPEFISGWLPPQTIHLTIIRAAGDDNRRTLAFTYDNEREKWLDEAFSD